MSHTQTDTTPAAIEALMKAYPTPRSPFSREPLLEVVYADPGSNGLYYRGKKPDSFAAFVRVDLFAAELATARAERDEARAEGAKLAAWQCSFTDGKTGLVCDEYGNQFCAMQRRAEKATTELASLRKEVERLRGALEWQAEQPRVKALVKAAGAIELRRGDMPCKGHCGNLGGYGYCTCGMEAKRNALTTALAALKGAANE